MKIAIFAARKTHRTYARKLKPVLAKAINGSVDVLWYKDLWRRPGWLPYLRYCPLKSLSEISADQMRTRDNDPEHLGKPGNPGTILVAALKKAEACITFATYFHALKRRGTTHLLLWNGLKFRQRICVEAAKMLNIPCYFIERGAFPGTTTLDPKGINYLNSVPRDPMFYSTLPQATDAPYIEYDCERPAGLPERYVFVPFQVNIDSQIVLFSPWIKHMPDLVRKMVESCARLGDKAPVLVFKPHPACGQDYSALEKSLESHPNIRFVHDIPAPDLIRHADAVATINSSIGMEALLMKKKVIVMGQAFYNLPRLTLSAANEDQLEHALAAFSEWEPDAQLRDRFLSHIASEHIVAGRWKDASLEHLDLVATRVKQLAGNA